MRSLLVTGGAGFIGSNFVRYWREQHADDRIVVLDALTYAGNPRNLDGLSGPLFRFVQGNIRDRALVEELLRDAAVDTLVHFAAETHVDRSIASVDAFLDTNVLGTQALLAAACKVWLVERSVPAHRFHHVSTDEVYGSLGAQDAPFDEAAPYAPNSPYAASKAASDHLVRACHRTFGLSVTTSNSSNNYGPRQFPEKLIPLCLTNLLLGMPLPIYGDGGNVRDWLHVSDHCRGIELVLERGRTGEVYNFGGRAECDNLSLINRLCAIVDRAFAARADLAGRFPDAPPSRAMPSASLITFVEDRAGHDWRYAIDGSKAQRELGFEPLRGLQQGLEETVDWYLGNESWWRAVLDGSYQVGAGVPAPHPHGP